MSRDLVPRLVVASYKPSVLILQLVRNCDNTTPRSQNKLEAQNREVALYYQLRFHKDLKKLHTETHQVKSLEIKLGFTRNKRQPKIGGLGPSEVTKIWKAST